MKSIKRIQLLDSLRGMAAIVVVIHHVFSLNQLMLKAKLMPSTFNILSWLSDKNVEAVLFFFLLSGFSIGLSLRDSAFNTKGEINQYIYRRTKRIFPLYWLTLLLSILLLFFNPTTYNASFSFHNLIGNLLFLQTPDVTGAWFIPYGDNGPLWSLSYEVFFYIIAVPLIFLRRKHFKRWTPLLFTFITFIIALSMITVHKFAPNPFASFLALFPIWVIGFELSQLYLAKKNNLYFLLLLTASWTFMYILESNYFKSDTLKVLNLGILLGAISYIIAVFYYQSTFAKILKPVINVLNLIFYKIGTASFSLYIFHYILLKTLKFYHYGLTVQILSVLVLAFVCYHLEKWFVKQPFYFFRRNYV